MFSGSMVALVTPMHTDGAVDWDSLEQLIEWHIQSGTDAIVSVGTTGESATLNFDEHKAVIRFTVEMVKKRVPVIAGAGGNATREAIELTFSAYHGGCDATLQVTPYYNRRNADSMPISSKSPTPCRCRSFSTTFPAAPAAICCPKPPPHWQKSKISSALKKPRP